MRNSGLLISMIVLAGTLGVSSGFRKRGAAQSQNSESTQASNRTSITVPDRGTAAILWTSPSKDSPSPEDGADEIHWPELPATLTGDWMKQQAHRVAEAIAAEYPDDVFALHILAQVYRLSGDTEQAIRVWSRCLELQKNFLPVYEEMVQIFIRRGEFTKAEDIARAGLAIHPHAVSLRYFLGNVLLEQGRLDQTIWLLPAGYALGTESPDGMFLLGQAYQRKQDHQRAKSAFQKAVQLRPDFTEAPYALSVSLMRLGDNEGP